MNLEELIGKKFKYKSPYGGLSIWTDTIKEIFYIHKIQYTPEILSKLQKSPKFDYKKIAIEEGSTKNMKNRIQAKKDLSIGYMLEFMVRGEKMGHAYELKNIVIIE